MAWMDWSNMGSVGSADRMRQRLQATPGLMNSMRTGTGTTGLMPGDARGWSDLQNDWKAYLDEGRESPMPVKAMHSTGVLGGDGDSGGGYGGRMPRDPMQGLMRAANGGGGMGGFDIPAGAQAEIGRLMGRRMMEGLQGDDIVVDGGFGPTVQSRSGAANENNFREGLERSRESALYGDETAGMLAPRQAQRTLDMTRQFGVPMAEAEADIGDVTSERGAARHFMPWQAGKNADVSQTALERILQQYVRPAELDLERAGVTAQGQLDLEGMRQGTAQSGDALQTLQELVSSGMGLESAQPTIAPFVQELQRRLLPGGGRAGGAGPAGGGGGPMGGPGGPPPAASGPTPQQMQAAIQAGYTEAEVLEYYRNLQRGGGVR